MSGPTRSDQARTLLELAQELERENRASNEFAVDPQNKIRVFLRLTEYSPSVPPKDLKLGGNLVKVSYTYGQGKSKLYIFKTDADGEISILDTKREQPTMVSSIVLPSLLALNSPVLFLPAANFGKSAKLGLLIGD
ncbi:hypothetical protein FJZ17_00325 [Candidatus Pacearchaeota archaeon]|nr:hypothetical protein [Candidatus Pacearchaeota archaeon]